MVMTDNQKTELEEAIEDLDGLMDFAQPETSETANQVQILVNAAKKFAELSDYILIRRDDVPDLSEAIRWAEFELDFQKNHMRNHNQCAVTYTKSRQMNCFKVLGKTARLVQAAMEDK